MGAPSAELAAAVMGDVPSGVGTADPVDMRAAGL